MALGATDCDGRIVAIREGQCFEKRTFGRTAVTAEARRSVAVVVPLVILSTHATGLSGG